MIINKSLARCQSTNPFGDQGGGMPWFMTHAGSMPTVDDGLQNVIRANNIKLKEKPRMRTLEMRAAQTEKRILGPGLAALVMVIITTIVTPGQPGASRNLVQKIDEFTPAGWQIFGTAKQFGKENLWEQINGRASFFLAYDMVRMTFVSFVNRSNESQFIDLSIYDMGNPTNAFGVFSSERSQDAPPVQLGRAGYRSDASYFIWKGRYYIRIISSEISDSFKQTGMELARRVTDTLTDSGEPVWGLTALPPADQIPRSVRYIKINAMGLDFMRDTYMADYRSGAKIVTVFLSKYDTAKSAREAVVRYIEYANHFGEGVDEMTVNGVALVTCNMGGMYDVVFHSGQLMGGVASVEDRDLAVHSAIELWKQLPQDK